MPQSLDPEDVLTFWFGELDEQGDADETHTKSWFMKDEAFDQQLRERFAATHAAVAGGHCEDWLGSARGLLAYLLVLDQFSRNMFRGTGKMFAQDARALEVAREAIRVGMDKELAFAQRTFLYMPLMHSEALADQDECIAAFTAFRNEVSGKQQAKLDEALKYAEAHRNIIQRFGRFPHRNAACGRESTAEEAEFLTQPGSSF